MRTKSTVLVSIAFAAIAMQGVFTSCSSEETVNTEKPTGPQTLTLNLKPADTRAAVYTDPTAENTINSVTIGIFDNYNNVKTIQEVTTNSTTLTITTSQLVADDKILVAVNAKKGTFTGAKTVTEFENKTLAIDDALAGSVGSTTIVASDKLPMFGTGSIKATGTPTAFTASVDVYHMVAKITLNSLTVNFSGTGGYKDAKFTPTEVFMSNVPDVLDFYPATDMSSYSTFATYSNSNLCQGEETNNTNFKAYLGTTTTLTGFKAKNTTLSGISGAATSSWGTPDTKILFLYTMPNNATTPTRLVIKGTFDPDGTGEKVAVPVYYPVNINYNSTDGSAVDGGTVKQVYPNKNYIIDVTIQGQGSKNPTDAIADPQTVKATITVKDFTPATQSNVFF